MTNRKRSPKREDLSWLDSAKRAARSDPRQMKLDPLFEAANQQNDEPERESKKAVKSAALKEPNKVRSS